MAPTWLLCSYRLPRTPTRLRLAVWRRLRKLGAVMLQDGLWTLPSGSAAREAFEWIAEEVDERGGTVLLWEARSLGRKQDEELNERFRTEAGKRYNALTEGAEQLARLVRKANSRSREQILARLRILDRAIRTERRREYLPTPERARAEAAIRSAFDRVRSNQERSQRERRPRAVGD